MNDHDHWLTRWLAAPYQAMLRSLGQAPASVQEQSSTELLVDGADGVPDGIRASAVSSNLLGREGQGG